MTELPKQDEIHLYNLSLIPAGVLVAVFWVLFIYLMHNNALKTLWETMLFITPFWILIIGTVFFTFEVLYGRRTQASLVSCKASCWQNLSPINWHVIVLSLLRPLLLCAVTSHRRLCHTLQWRNLVSNPLCDLPDVQADS